MENFAHFALWTFPYVSSGAAVLAPRSQAFLEEIRLLGDVSYDNTRELYLFPPSRISTAQVLIGRFFPDRVCQICMSGIPCWYWKERSLTTTTLGWLTNRPVEKPATPEAEMQMRLNVNRNVLAQIVQTSPDIRTVLRNPTPTASRRSQVRQPRSQRIETTLSEAELRELDRLPTTVQQAPTPIGTIRCHACGQVVPPGFDKTKDTKRTEDEIYAECQHNFDEESICRKCKLPRRSDKGSRFSWLEVD